MVFLEGYFLIQANCNVIMHVVKGGLCREWSFWKDTQRMPLSSQDDIIYAVHEIHVLKNVSEKLLLQWPAEGGNVPSVPLPLDLALDSLSLLN